ncbi:MAG TPA: hypothetical protein VFU13_11360 [Steroidobacteraceae bacterium]|nr:hypothetical protein [Steroidobacteraceae bacterium]
MSKVIGPVVLLACALVLLGCAPASLACEGKLKITDGQLLEAVQSSLAKSSIIPVTDEDATTLGKYIERALRRTFEKDIVALAADHSCSVHANGENRFSIHVLGFRDQAAAGAATALIEKRTAHTLAIESLTYYSFMQAGTSLLFFIADRESFEANEPVFAAIKATYQAR